MTKDQAKEFLRKSNYYIRIKAFTYNFEKDKNGIYVNLDFKYLKKFSVWDTLLRDLILEISLGCEHFLKVKLHQHFCETDEDRYEIIKKFEEKCDKKINLNPENHYIQYLSDKYQELPLWAYIEFLTFNELLEFIKFYKEKYPCFECPSDSLMFCVRKLRNASAHNNTILNYFIRNPKHSRFSQSTGLIDELKILGLYNKNTKKKIKNILLHDLLCLLIAYKQLASEEALKEAKNNIKSFFKKCHREKYFEKHGRIISQYDFIHRSFYKIFIKL